MINGLALCSGGYGLESGLHLVMPGVYRTVCAVERQAYPVACLVSAMEKKALAPFPIWDNVATFDPVPWRGIVHIVTAGYPCQPFSLAGKRLGEDDPRYIWPHIFRIIRALMPAIVFCENVAAHLATGFSAVKGDLESLGYRVEAGIFSAAEVGAPHLRERLFIYGQLSDARIGTGAPGPERSRRAQGPDADRSGAGAELADDDSSRKPQRQGGISEQRGRIGDCCTGLEHTHDGDSNGRPDIQGRQAQGGTSACGTGGMGNAESQPERAGLCPEQSQGFGIGRSGDAGDAKMGNSDSEGLQNRGQVLPAFNGHTVWPWPAGRGAEQYAWEEPRLTQPGLGRATDGVGTRNEQLHMLGNGVVPVDAALAFVALWEKVNGAGPSRCGCLGLPPFPDKG